MFPDNYPLRAQDLYNGGQYVSLAAGRLSLRKNFWQALLAIREHEREPDQTTSAPGDFRQSHSNKIAAYIGNYLTHCKAIKKEYNYH